MRQSSWSSRRFHSLLTERQKVMITTLALIKTFMEEAEEIKSGPVIRWKKLRFAQSLVKVPGDVVTDAETVRSVSVPASARTLSEDDYRRLDELLYPIIKCYPRPAWPEPWSIYLYPMSFQRSRPSNGLFDFLDALIGATSGGKPLKQYTFFEQSCLYPNLISDFINQATSFMPFPGVGVRPELGPPRFPTKGDVDSLDQKSLIALMDKKKQNTSMQDLFPGIPPAVYWIKQNHSQARELLMGEGGWGFILSSLEEQPFFQVMKSSLLAGVDSEAMKSIPIVVPLLSVNSFLNESTRTLRQWFDAMKLYLCECSQAGGLVIAAPISLDNVLVELVERSGMVNRDAALHR
jgi:hypothetical protein